MKKLGREEKRKAKGILKKIEKQIFGEQIEAHNSKAIREINSSFHTDSENFGMVREKILISYSIHTRKYFTGKIKFYNN